MTSDDDPVIRSEERLTVSTEQQQIELVRLGKRNVTPQETVTGEVHKEQIEPEPDD